MKKALTSLPPRFKYTTTKIRKTKDLKRMTLEELMGSLLMFEIELNKESKERKKLIRLRVESKLLVDEGNELSESMTLLSNNFERAIKRLNAQEKGNPQTRKIAFATLNPIKFGRTLGSPRPNIMKKTIQCREC